MKSASELFEGKDSSLFKTWENTAKKGGLGGSERAGLIKFFIDTLKDKNNKPYKPARIGMLLAHIPTKDLYYFISTCKDTLNRRGQVAMQKHFFWSIKSK